MKHIKDSLGFNRNKIYLIIAIGWTVFITVVSLWSFSGVSGIKSEISDKAIHVIFYFLYTILWYHAVKSKEKRHLLLKTMAISFGYGILIEVLQYIMPFNRYFEIKDIFANGLGTCIAAGLIKGAEIALKRKE